MAEVRTVKIKDPKKAKMDKDGNLEMDKDGKVQFSKNPEDYRIITEADYIANQIGTEGQYRYELLDEDRAKSGHNPVVEAEQELRQEVNDRHMDELAGERDMVKKTGGPKLSAGELNAGVRIEKEQGKDKGRAARDASSDISDETTEVKKSQAGKEPFKVGAHK